MYCTIQGDGCTPCVLYKVMVVFAYQRSWIIFSHSHFLLLWFPILPSLPVFVATISQLHRVVYLVRMKLHLNMGNLGQKQHDYISRDPGVFFPGFPT